MKHKIIGIAGPARVGKDTAADFIMRELPEYSKISFADPIKEMLRVGLGLSQSQLYGNKKEMIDDRYGCSARHLMQTLGTEWGRNIIDQNLWVSAVRTHIADTCSDFIIPDVRFESEAQMIREEGKLIHIVGKNTINSKHKSEEGIYKEDRDLIIYNVSTLEAYENILATMVSAELS